jgi:RNA polymerase sigma-70 factor (ECF subfamily)
MEVSLAENSTVHSIKRWLGGAKESSIPNSDVFSRLYEKTYFPVFRYIFGLSGGPPQEVEDLTAETYARAWKARQRFTGDEDAALRWFLQIARNLIIDQSRRHKAHELEENFSIDLLVDPAQLPETDVIAQEQIVTLWQLLATLTTDVREMLVLRYMLGWQVRQIARHLGLNENTVTVTIKRTLRNLQRDWPQSQEQEND